VHSNRKESILMRIVTSISLNRIPRQQYCIDSWTKHTNDIVAIQTQNEIDALTPHFSKVSFRNGDTSSSFSKATPKLTELIKVADVPTILINSDISIKDDNLSRWNPEPGKLKIGIRQDYYPNRPKKYLQKYGIDAFLILPEMVSIIPDLDFCVGCPGWDFWLPYHLWSQHNYEIEVVKCDFLHELHPIGWAKEDQISYRNRMTKHYKVTPTMLPYFILDITNRHKTKHVMWK
jgi:hypothetical protein